ncbi:MAG: hypothetical protein ACRDYU_14195 [Actinomycetes bacterium]
MGTPREATALRRCVLAVAVLDDLDLMPGDTGVTLGNHDVSLGGAGDSVVLPWDEVARALRDANPDSLLARTRLAGWVRDRLALADQPHPDVLTRVRPVGLPVGHVLHPGAGWVRVHVPGGALDLGLGVLGLRGDPERVDVPDPAVLRAAGVDLSPAWELAQEYLEDMGTCSAPRVLSGDTVLRPYGDCDVVTLLASTALRAALCTGAGNGMRAAVVPMRQRGWLDPRRVDPAFAGAAAAAVDSPERGFVRPVLVTRDEVVLARAGGSPVEILLRDPATSAPPWTRSVRYR